MNTTMHYPAAPQRHSFTARVCMAMLALATLSACGDPRDAFNRDPQLSDMSITGNSMPEATFVQVPMPPPEPPRMLHRAEAASLWQRGSGGFFADQRASRVGDILTIDIRIDDRAQMRNASQRERSGSGSAGFPSILGLDNLPTGDIIDLSSTFEAEGSGSINRGESIDLKVAALVIQSLPNGNLVIAGRQEVKVNQELRELRVAGIIRPQDIQMNNTIAYEKVAEARITYGGRGQLSRQQQRSYGEDIVDIVLPY
ncbi:MAG: flagellar basal body L-ring protein FlgH [Paracoccaceae bacterium]|nr:flagellar basal body L-ring protein FlgH [Paracoccaceae bacterium]